MKLSRSVTYALKAALKLAQNDTGRPMPCSRIASMGAMPERFLLQILRSLVTHGILKSTRGVDGGYVLLRDASTISLLDVIEAIEGPLNHEFNIGEGLSERSREKLSNVMDEVTQATLDALSSVKLADLIFDDGPSAPPETTQAEISPSVGDTRIDAPTGVQQTPNAIPPSNPVPEATANQAGNPSEVQEQASDQPVLTKVSAAPNVSGPSDSVPNVYPNSQPGV